MEALGRTDLMAASATGFNHKKRSSNSNSEFSTTPTTAINAFDVLMATAKRKAHQEAASKRQRKNNNKTKNAFEVMMENAKTPGIFESPTVKLLLDGCKNVANLVRVAANADNEAKNKTSEDYYDDDDDDHEDEDEDDDLDSEVEKEEQQYVLEAFLDFGNTEDRHVSDANDKVDDCRDENLGKHTKSANLPAMLDQVVFAHPKMTEFGVEKHHQHHSGEGVYVTKIGGHFDMKLKRHVIVALSFHYSDGTEVIYDNGQDIKGAKVTEISLAEGEHLVSLETIHFSLPRMLQSMILHTNQGRSLSLGKEKHAPLVSIRRTFKSENNHVIRGLQWLADESTILLLQTQSVDDIRMAQPHDESSSSSSSSSSLVHLAHECEYKRLHDHACNVKTRAMTDMKNHWTQVRHHVYQVSGKYQDLLRETDEAKALNEIKIVQTLLHKRFDEKAKLLQLQAKREMDAALKQGRAKEQEIKAKYISDGSECLKEHQSAVNQLSFIGLGCYSSMKSPTVCSNLACRKTFDLAATTLSSTSTTKKRCSVPDCVSTSSSAPPNCGCQVHHCPVCHESCCHLHYKDHEMWCLWNLEKKCGYDKKTNTLKSSGCHKRSLEQASLLTCQTCGVQCCKTCCDPCTWCDDLDLEDVEYVYCKHCQFVLGNETLCSGCYHDACRE